MIADDRAAGVRRLFFRVVTLSWEAPVAIESSKDIRGGAAVVLATRWPWY